MTSFLSRHRTICEVLEEIRSTVDNISGLSGEWPDAELKQITALIDEAKDYAQRMSARLTEYKYKENTSG